MKLFRPSLYPVMLAAGIVVLIFSVLAIAAMTGYIPNAHSVEREPTYQELALPAQPEALKTEQHPGAQANRQSDAMCPAGRDLKAGAVDGPDVEAYAAEEIELHRQVRFM